MVLTVTWTRGMAAWGLTICVAAVLVSLVAAECSTDGSSGTIETYNGTQYCLSNGSHENFECKKARELCSPWNLTLANHRGERLHHLVRHFCVDNTTVPAFHVRLRMDTNDSDYSPNSHGYDLIKKDNITVFCYGKVNHECDRNCKGNFVVRLCKVECRGPDPNSSKNITMLCANKSEECKTDSTTPAVTSASTTETAAPDAESSTSTLPDDLTTLSASSVPALSKKNFEKLKKQLQEKIKKKLTINKSTLSSTRARKISAPDGRRSSQYMGVVAITFLSFVFGLIVLSDLSKLYQWYQDRKRRSTRRHVQDCEKVQRERGRQTTVEHHADTAEKPEYTFTDDTRNPAPPERITTQVSNVAKKRSKMSETPGENTASSVPVRMLDMQQILEDLSGTHTQQPSLMNGTKKASAHGTQVSASGLVSDSSPSKCKPDSWRSRFKHPLYQSDA